MGSAEHLNSLRHEAGGSLAIGIQGLPEPVIRQVHLAQVGQNFWGTAVVPPGDVGLPPGHQGLDLRMLRHQVPAGSKGGKEFLFLCLDGRPSRFVIAFGLLLALSPGCCGAPARLGLLGIGRRFFSKGWLSKGVNCMAAFSFQGVFHQGKKAVQPLALLLQQIPLGRQGGLPVIARGGKDGLDLYQGEFQLRKNKICWSLSSSAGP